MKRGFTLLETIFASVLFAFIVLFILNLYPGSIVAIRRGESQIVADNYAQTILEDLRSRTFANVTTATASYQKLVYANTEYDPLVDIHYHSDVASVPEEFLKIARVTVSWKFQNRTNQVVHTMYLHNVTR